MNYGKLIISKNNDSYVTFHKLNLIVISGNKNDIDIDHRVDKIVIDGNSKIVSINPQGKVRKIIFKGNNNDIYCFFDSSFNCFSDFGKRNNIYIKYRNNENDSSEEEEDEQDEEEEQEDYEQDDEDEEDNSIQSKISIYNEDYNKSESEDEDEDSDNSRRKNNRPRNRIFENKNNKVKKRIQHNTHSSRLNIRNSNNNSDSKDSGEDEDDDIFSELIVISYKHASKIVKEENEKCVICYDNFKKNEKVGMTGCFHIFHYKCILKWIKSKKESVEAPYCPICRRKLLIYFF